VAIPENSQKLLRGRRTDGDQTSQRILDAAGALFAANGFAETTSKAIAQQAEADQASINYHFGSRSGLYQATLAEAHRQLITLGALEVIVESEQAATDKLAQFIDLLAHSVSSEQGWPLQLLARELLSPSSHLQVLLTQEVQPKLALVLRILSEASGIEIDDPVLLRCLVSVVAPCLMLVVVGGRLPGPAQIVRQMSKKELSRHFHIFAQAGLLAVSQERLAQKAKTKRAK
jgi:AcrR family transcriptional regulator